MVDKETQQIISEEKWLAELTQHEGWKIARLKLLEKIKLLRDAFELDESSPEKMLIDLQSRKAAVQLLLEFLGDIEGSKEIVNNNAPLTGKSYIVKLD